MWRPCPSRRAWSTPGQQQRTIRMRWRGIVGWSTARPGACRGGLPGPAVIQDRPTRPGRSAGEGGGRRHGRGLGDREWTSRIASDPGKYFGVVVQVGAVVIISGCRAVGGLLRPTDDRGIGLVPPRSRDRRRRDTQPHPHLARTVRIDCPQTTGLEYQHQRAPRPVIGALPGNHHPARLVLALHERPQWCYRCSVTHTTILSVHHHPPSHRWLRFPLMPVSGMLPGTVVDIGEPGKVTDYAHCAHCGGDR